jgi:hypothetical protein
MPAPIGSLNEYAHVLARNGSIVATWRGRGDGRTGPYFRLAFRDKGKQRSLYLGSDPVAVEEIRRWLADLQETRLRVRRERMIRKVLAQELARARMAWRQELEKIGLFLKGHEIRGWRNQNTRAALAAALETED